MGSDAASMSLGGQVMGTVQSIFRRALNILTPDNRLVSIVRSDVERGPFSIVTDLPVSVSLDSVGVEAGDEVIGARETIVVGDNALVISTRDARLYKPPRDFRDPLPTLKRIEGNLRILKAVTLSHGRRDGLGGLIACPESGEAEPTFPYTLNPYAREAFPRLSALLRLIDAGTLPGVSECALRLIGFGPGLTPAADDLLSGLMASSLLTAENLEIEPVFFSKVNRAIISSARGRTGLISQAYLIHAAAGEANEHLLTLIRKLITGKPFEVTRATKDMLSLGGTSGTDIAAGVFLGTYLVLGRARVLRRN